MTEIQPFAHWQQCLKLSNGTIDLIVLIEAGPRILFFGFCGGENLLKVYDPIPDASKNQWLVIGGHRLWHAPEHPQRSYWPDNEPVDWQRDGSRLRLTQPVERSTGIQKEIEIELGTRASVTVTHRLINRGLWPVEAAPWALTVMQPGGTAHLPQEPFRPHPKALLPSRPLVLWPYTNMADERLEWGRRTLAVRSGEGSALKLGVFNSLGWGAYERNGLVFLKQTRSVATGNYPDHGCNFEIFTQSGMLELETLGPLARLEPDGGCAEHVEVWTLFRNTVADDDDERAAQFEGMVAMAKNGGD